MLALRDAHKVEAVVLEFDPGPVAEPFVALAGNYPGAETYPAQAFRVEWGPVFHRGRLDGTARALVVGQDPATSEDITRRILVGTAGHRTQGFLAKLGFTRSYVMINTFLYSVYGQQGGEQHKDDPGIVAYRNSWLTALTQTAQLDVVIALGHLADDAWRKFSAQASPAITSLPYAHITHPTEPESSSGSDPHKLAQAIKAMLANWNTALQRLYPQITHPDVHAPLALYGETFAPGDLGDIPESDLPPGLPAWMRSAHAWAQRTGTTAGQKRATITITIPDDGTGTSAPGIR